MHTKRQMLNPEEFEQQILRYGLFYEQIPACFTTASFAQHAHDLLKPEFNIRQPTKPLNINIYKYPHDRRIISAPNPFSFLVLVDFLKQHWKLCHALTDNTSSNSPITYFGSYVDHEHHKTKREELNSEPNREKMHARSAFARQLRERIALSAGCTYKLSVDIENFYNSIHTDVLTWSLCGKQAASEWKSLLESGEAQNFPQKKPKYYDFATECAYYISLQNDGNAEGILSGPFTSRIFSELLLCGIDKLLSEEKTAHKSRYLFRRYVDDYSFYFTTKRQATDAIDTINTVLSSFDLRLNSHKTRIERFPFDVLHDIAGCLRPHLEDDDLFTFLNTAARLTQDGHKGAYLYAIKMLASAKKEFGINETVLAQLLNIGLSYPHCALFVLKVLKNNSSRFDHRQFSSIICTFIQETLACGHDQEIINSLYFARELGIELSLTILADVIKQGNDLACILALDMAQHLSSINEENVNAVDTLKRAKAVRKEMLRDDTTDGEHWLLLYEAKNHNLLDVSLGYGGTRDFFLECARREISFYKGLDDPDFSWIDNEQ